QVRVEAGEGDAGDEGGEPEGEPRRLHRGGVHVHAEEAALHHHPPQQRRVAPGGRLRLHPLRPQPGRRLGAHLGQAGAEGAAWPPASATAKSTTQRGGGPAGDALRSPRGSTSTGLPRSSAASRSPTIPSSAPATSSGHSGAKSNQAPPASRESLSSAGTRKK